MELCGIVPELLGSNALWNIPHVWLLVKTRPRANASNAITEPRNWGNTESDMGNGSLGSSSVLPAFRDCVAKGSAKPLPYAF